jgi:hypothetical protein
VVSIATGLQRLLDSDASLLMENRIPEMVEHFGLPFVMQLEDRMILYRTEYDFVRGQERFRCILKRKGVVEMRPRLRMMDGLRPGRFRAWVNTSYVGEAGPMMNSSAALYYGRLQDDRWMFEMMHLTHLPFAEVRSLAPRDMWSG